MLVKFDILRNINVSSLWEKFAYFFLFSLYLLLTAFLSYLYVKPTNIGWFSCWQTTFILMVFNQESQNNKFNNVGWLVFIFIRNYFTLYCFKLSKLDHN